MQKRQVAIKLEQEAYEKIIKIALERNVSLWIRTLVMRELEKLGNGEG
jgi:hypothetical protein